MNCLLLILFFFEYGKKKFCWLTSFVWLGILFFVEFWLSRFQNRQECCWNLAKFRANFFQRLLNPVPLNNTGSNSWFDSNSRIRSSLKFETRKCRGRTCSKWTTRLDSQQSNCSLISNSWKRGCHSSE